MVMITRPRGMLIASIIGVAFVSVLFLHYGYSKMKTVHDPLITFDPSIEPQKVQQSVQQTVPVTWQDGVSQVQSNRIINRPEPYIISDVFRSIGYHYAGANEPSRLLPTKYGKDPAYDTVIDLGAFDGVDHTIPAYQRGYTVYSYEPSANNRARILNNFKAFGWKENVDFTVILPAPNTTAEQLTAQVEQIRKDKNYAAHIFLVAAGCGEKRETFVVTKSNEMAEVAAVPKGEQPPPGAETVEIVPLNAIVPLDARIFILKIDVQGHEKAVLDGSGGLQLFRRVKTLALEFWPYGLRRHGTDPVELLRRLYRDYGLTCYDMGTYEKAVPFNRPGEIAQFVAVLEAIPRTDNVGGWEDLICQ